MEGLEYVVKIFTFLHLDVHASIIYKFYTAITILKEITADIRHRIIPNRSAIFNVQCSRKILFRKFLFLLYL